MFLKIPKEKWLNRKSIFKQTDRSSGLVKLFHERKRKLIDSIFRPTFLRRGETISRFWSSFLAKISTHSFNYFNRCVLNLFLFAVFDWNRERTMFLVRKISLVQQNYGHRRLCRRFSHSLFIDHHDERFNRRFTSNARKSSRRNSFSTKSTIS